MTETTDKKEFINDLPCIYNLAVDLLPELLELCLVLILIKYTVWYAQLFCLVCSIIILIEFKL